VRDVEIGLVQAHGFHQIAEAPENRQHLGGDVPIDLKAGRNEDSLKAVREGIAEWMPKVRTSYEAVHCSTRNLPQW
jgi:hypothetical protein